VGCGTVPMLLAGLEEHPVTGPDRLDRAVPPLAHAKALGDVDRLPVGVRVPRGPGAGREVDARGLNARWLGWRGNGVDVDRAGEPIAWSGSGLERVPGD